MNRLDYGAESISNFWQAVAETGRYDQEPQTWEWPEDLRRAIELVEEKQPEILVAFGCADGCRDPKQLVEAAQEQGYSISKVIAIDCTDRFEDDVRDRIGELGLEDKFAFLLNE
jgi:hypothetical protein